jgi:hypothetical protein
MKIAVFVTSVVGQELNSFVTALLLFKIKKRYSKMSFCVIIFSPTRMLTK